MFVKILTLILALSYSPFSSAEDCEFTLSENEARLIIDRFRKESPGIPKIQGEYNITVSKNPQSCHYIYAESPVKRTPGGIISFLINKKKSVVDIRTAVPLKRETYNCPRMNLNVQDLQAKVVDLRKKNKNTYPKQQKNYNAERMSILKCLYVFEEFNKDRSEITQGNQFYFDAEGELIGFYPPPH